MSKKLVAYFSASGVTKRLAGEIAALEQADLFEIVPKVPYTAQDLDYTRKDSRSSAEMADVNCRPEVLFTVEDMAQYDTVFIGFPVWWGREPSVVDTFLDAYDFTGKQLIPFCTSGGSGIEGASERIAALTGAKTDRGIRLGGTYSEEELKVWTDGLELL